MPSLRRSKLQADLLNDKKKPALVTNSKLGSVFLEGEVTKIACHTDAKSQVFAGGCRIASSSAGSLSLGRDREGDVNAELTEVGD